jgi:iron complex outermembrane recepter protein
LGRDVLPVDDRGRKAGGSHARFFIIAALVLAPALAGVRSTSAQTPPAQDQTATNPNALPSIRITARAKRHGQVRKPKAEATAPSLPNNAQMPSQPLAGIPMTPLNTVTQSATRLGLPIIQTPASVEVVDQRTMQEQGYRTTTETAQGAVGVLAGDSAGAPANFSMRGFAGPQVNVLYNGIWTGPTDITSRWMDTANLAQVEFLKGPSSLMSGLNAIGGAVNYVSRQPTSGLIRNEIDAYLDSFGSFRSHFGSGGSTPVRGLDYRFDVSGARYNSFIDGDFRDITGVATQLNYRVTDAFKTFLAIEYKKDSGHAYWGTPVVPVSFAGSHAVNGV